MLRSRKVSMSPVNGWPIGTGYIVGLAPAALGGRIRFMTIAAIASKTEMPIPIVAITRLYTQSAERVRLAREAMGKLGKG